jgi:putative nucleotidyltransferase with HDIG domain
LKRAAAKKLRERDENRGSAFAEESIGPLGVIFSLAMIACTVAIMDYGVLPPAYPVGSRAANDIKARLDFTYNDPDELNKLREEAIQRAPRAYVEDPAWVENTLHDLSELMAIVDVASSSTDARERAGRFPAELRLVEELYKYNEENGAGRRKFLSSTLLEYIRSRLKSISDTGVLTEENLKFERNKPGELREIIRLTPAAARAALASTHTNEPRPRVSVEQLRDIQSAREMLETGTWRNGLSGDLKFQLSNYFMSKLTANLQLDETQTDIEKDRARDAVGSGEILVHRNDSILVKGQTITKSKFDKLHEEYRAYKKALALSERVRHLTGLTTLTFGILMCFLFAASRLQESVFRRRQALVMLGLLCVVTLAVTKLLMLAGMSMALAPLVFVGMVASIAFGQAVTILALFSVTILSMFSGIVWEASLIEVGVPAVPLAMLVGGIAAALPAQTLQDRWDLLRYGAVGGIAQGVLVAGLSLLGQGVGIPTLADAAIAGLNGPFCGLLVLGSLPLIESMMGILTNIRLFELCDMNQPALRRLQLEAPGTFAHTLQVRFLAEPASDAIGGNTRLVSAGVLYHDLGKTLKPEYFVENQMDAETLHQRLRPSVSALLITAHVKDGIELAREYKLPQQIIDFIPEHHGTTLVSYFFHTAKKSAEAEAEAAGNESGVGVQAVQESFFRYPGPKPRSRETGIVMLADTVEAASRTLSSPSAARLQGFVHDLIMDKMLDGQLDECELTFADLTAIEDAFVRVLVTRFHSRIRYPGQQPEEGEMGESTGKTTIIDAPPPGSITPKPAPAPAPVSSPTPTPAPMEAPSTRRQAMTETHFLTRRQSGKGSGGT